jgi:hypothetical protein
LNVKAQRRAEEGHKSVLTAVTFEDGGEVGREKRSKTSAQQPARAYNRHHSPSRQQAQQEHRARYLKLHDALVLCCRIAFAENRFPLFSAML